MSKKAPSSDSIPWAVILSTMTHAIISAWLVFMRDWDAWEAMFAVSASVLGILSLLMAVTWLLAEPEGRDEFLCGLKSTFHDDIDRILKYFRIRRRR